MSTKKKHILFQAAPFCFGPIATTLNVVRELAGSGHHLTLIGEGPTHDLLDREDFEFDKLPASTVKPFSEELEQLIREADLVVSNTDPPFAAACIRRGAKVVVIDTLFWMWDHIDPILLQSDSYIIQNFIGVEQQMARIGRPQNLLVVGPLTQKQEQPIPQGERDNFLLVSLGGCDCNLVAKESDPYPEIICRLIECVLEQESLDIEVMLATGERSANALCAKTASVQIGTFSNKEHVDLIRRAKGVMLSPGLTGSMEVFEGGTPVFFLPPQNYSQVLQMKAFRRSEVAGHSFSWFDVYPELAPPPYLPEEEAVAIVRDAIGKCIQDEKTWTTFYQTVKAFLETGIQNFDPTPGYRLRTRLGIDGVRKASERILQILEE
ncbi:MAG: hypothetical protein KDC32_11865 [Saprospiraceae bacterium]|nr:hypothetical protein [Saprospiraceae bacterium]MCB0681594.1 hypothetical protein [Saprospiraceae bacterium]